MLIFLKRLFALLLCSLGAVAAFFPFHFHTLTSQPKKIVRIVELGLLSNVTNKSAILAQAHEINETDDKDFPKIFTALNRIVAYKSNSYVPVNVVLHTSAPQFINLPLKEARAFINLSGNSSQNDISITYKNFLFNITCPSLGLFNKISDLGSSPTAYIENTPVTLEIRNAVRLFSDSTMLEFTRAKAAQFPFTINILSSSSDSISIYARDKIMPTLSEWQKLLENCGVNSAEELRFSFEGRVFDAKPAIIEGKEKLLLKDLRQYLRFLGVLLIVLALITGRNLHGVQEHAGLSLASTGNIVLLDILLLFISAGAWIMLVDFLLARYWQSVPLLGDAGLLQVTSAIWLFVGLPACILYVSVLSAQRLFIDKKGLKVKGLFSDRAVSWSELQAVRLSDYYLPISRLDMIFFRKSLTNLKFRGADQTVNILEPAVGKKKARIISLLEDNMPAEWKERIKQVGQEW